MATFADWLGTLLGHSEWEVQRLLEDPNALYFLIAWSLFESKCFGGFLKVDRIRPFADEVAGDLQISNILPAGRHFHGRYQDERRLLNLLHKQDSAELRQILGKPFDSLGEAEILFLCVFVGYRFRNNIFHGNKGVVSWLQFKPQIEHCIGVMQVLVTHSESKTFSMRIEAAA